MVSYHPDLPKANPIHKERANLIYLLYKEKAYQKVLSFISGMPKSQIPNHLSRPIASYSDLRET